ncbi:MAG: hypothetical protein IAF94_17445 [Pirellulaceae bacterium]|nr:hypothetical protein [Pirellulaceae bacterium]
MNRQQVLSLILCVVIHRLSRASDADEPSPALQVSIVASNQELQVGDGLSAELFITNRSISTVQVSGAFVKPQYLCSIHVKNTEESWSPVWYSLDPKMLYEPGVLRIPAGETWTEYAAIPVSTNRGQVFLVPGIYEMRATLVCVLGKYTTESVKLTVRKTDAAALALIKKHEVSLSTLFNATSAPNSRRRDERQRRDEIMELRSRVTSGSNHQTLKLFSDVIDYRESGSVEGEALTHYEAFKKMEPGLDEVRRDQLAILMASEARRLNKWKEVFELAGELKEDSAPRRVFRAELDRVIHTGGFRMP